jgi:hypothetical protein
VRCAVVVGFCWLWLAPSAHAETEFVGCDLTYSDMTTRALARCHPDLALRNAESYEAFVATLAGRRTLPDLDVYEDEGG